MGHEGYSPPASPANVGTDDGESDSGRIANRVGTDDGGSESGKIVSLVGTNVVA